MTYDKNKWIYENDSIQGNRYILGTKGVKPLLCFGINPSTAKPGELDNTLQSVARLALNNGFDSWIMMNVYPQRATNPNDMHKRMQDEIHTQNLKHIENILSQNDTTIWAAWGTLIEKRTYLADCLFDIHALSSKYHCKWVSIGKVTKKGHPHHPLYVRKIEKAKSFDIETYIREWKESGK